MNELVLQNQHLPSDPAQLQEYYRRAAEEYASSERRAGSSISVRNGVMSIGDQPIPGNMFAAIILDAVRLNTFYGEAFNPSNITPPRCFAIGRSDPEMAPHPAMAKDLSYFQPQADRCGACPHNEFGTNRTGNGKACANRRRLILLVAGHYVNSGPGGWQLQPNLAPESYATAPLVNMTLPPTSVAGWGEWVRNVSAQYQRPPMGMIARVYLYPHPKHGKEAIGFESLAPVPDDWAPHVLSRMQEAQQEAFEGYEPPKRQQQGGGFHQQQGMAQGQPSGFGQAR